MFFVTFDVHRLGLFEARCRIRGSIKFEDNYEAFQKKLLRSNSRIVHRSNFLLYLFFKKGAKY